MATLYWCQLVLHLRWKVHSGRTKKGEKREKKRRKIKEKKKRNKMKEKKMKEKIRGKKKKNGRKEKI